jgi:hypothetical protein
VPIYAIERESAAMDDRRWQAEEYLLKVALCDPVRTVKALRELKAGERYFTNPEMAAMIGAMLRRKRATRLDMLNAAFGAVDWTPERFTVFATSWNPQGIAAAGRLAAMEMRLLWPRIVADYWRVKRAQRMIEVARKLLASQTQ